MGDAHRCILVASQMQRFGMGNQKPTLFDGTGGIDDIVEILDRMEANCPNPSSTSRKLWRLRCAKGGQLRGKETFLEKAVAMLADNDHMPGWFNQCPVASGIGDSSGNKRRNVDLVHWCTEEGRLTLVELKWGSGTPAGAVRQILRYGAAYLFCRTHRHTLPVRNRPAMSAMHVALRVAAPTQDYPDKHLRDCLVRARESLSRVSGRTGLPGLSMSLDALVFPEWFDHLPFTNGAKVRDSCDRSELTEEGRIIVDAFNGLASVQLDCEGTEG